MAHGSPIEVSLPADAATILSRLVSRARGGWEQVALLHGLATPPRVCVTAVEPVRNTHRRPGSFGVGASDYRTALARSTVVGLFHTHVMGGTPSPADRRLMRRLPLVHMIGSPGPAREPARLDSWIAAPDGSIRSLHTEVTFR